MPPKKRQRISQNKGVATMDTDNDANKDGNLASASLDQIDSIVDNLLDLVDADAGAPLDVTKIQEGLLALKGIQNELFDALRETETATAERQAMQEKRQKQLQALRYEQSHLETEIQKCVSYETTFLEKMVQDEQGESVDQFLKADATDPANRQKIVLKLQMEINARGSLERDLKNKQQKLESLQDEVKKKKAFLQSLPNHLASIERASIPLQKAMYGSDSKTVGLRMNGTSRRLRLDAAKTLPLALFTLFSSLQNYLDQAICQEQAATDDNSTTLSLAVTTTNGEKQEVILHVPVVVADANHGRPKKLSLHFQYALEQDAVTAVVSGGGANAVFAESVLEKLFPEDEDDETTKQGPASNIYSWCNYLAGLHRVERNVNQHSVRAIVRVLCRRLRANATLKSILGSLQRNQTILALPEDAAVEGTVVEHACKLSQFVSSQLENNQGGGNTMDTSFKVVFRKDTEQLAAQVELHKTFYPEVPPRWTLNLSQDAKPPLYDERLAEIEQKVNVHLLEAMKDTTEVSHEWILVHQLHWMMEAWDSW